ncbi:MAG TPA: hypothetical protein VGS27_35635 [Candidatus Sulfotelmatobacter sp.]|nr:hypothetical protein [Candidatus Sulfotelmatobacter sp.]
MSDVPQPPSAQGSAPQTTTTETPAGQPATPPPSVGPTINIGEEYGTAKKNLPPAKIVLIAVGAVLVVVLIASFLKRAKPQGSGSLDNVVAVDTGQNSTMVALTFTLHNDSDKALYIRELQSGLKTPTGDTKVDAVSAVDFDRYFQAFPDLRNGSQPALAPETRMEVGDTIHRTIIVAFPKTLAEFNQRQSVSVIIWPYNYTVPLVLTK